MTRMSTGSVRAVWGLTAIMLLAPCGAVPAAGQDTDPCSLDAIQRDPDQIVPLLERMKRMNCNLDKVLDELKRKHPEAWALLQKNATQPPPSDLSVTVKGRQYGWQFEYREASAGRATPRTCTADGPLILPQGKRVELIVTSDDVIHELSIPSLGVLVSGSPGRLSTVALETTKSGTFTGGATPMSGPKHADMAMEVRILEPTAFAEWEQQVLRCKVLP